MGKRTRRHPSERGQGKGVCNLEDRISLLPDEILVLILSFLRLKDAAITSVLSRRWKDLWAYAVHLNFDVSDKVDPEGYRDSEVVETETLKYISWVNQVVGLHKGPTIESFRVCFDLSKVFQSEIDKWVQFALAKRVKCLELDLVYFDAIFRSHMRYSFQYGRLGQIKGNLFNTLPSNNFLQQCTFTGFKSLKVLSLKNVNVTGEVLEYWLSNCPVLERLCVWYSNDLVNLKVVGSSLMLKYLKICYCENIESLEICKVNLVTLVYVGHMINLRLKHVPLLVELSVGGKVSVSPSLKVFLPQLSCCFSQIETLTLRICDFVKTTKFDVSPQLTNLKKFMLIPLAVGDKCLLGYTSLIEASPFLRKFVLKAEWMGNVHIRSRKVRKVAKCPHQYLEEVELLGYCGFKRDLELVMYFLENAAALKRIIIDPRDQFLSERPEENDDIEEEIAARSRAKQQLEGMVPDSVELVIL